MSGSTGDPWMDEQLEKWVSAKRQKDFATADAIRSELRALGVDPDTVRPRGGGTSNVSNTGNMSNSTDTNMMMQMMQMMMMMMQMKSGGDSNPAKKQKVSGGAGFGGAQTSTGDAWMEEQLDKWVIAKRSSDFVTADAIRDELRSRGVDPDTVRPRGWDGGGGGSTVGAKPDDAWVEERLDQWVSAKRQKDFATADAIRSELRAVGIDPDTVRPRGWSADGSFTGGGTSSTGNTGNMSNGMDENGMMQMMQMMMQMSGAAGSNPSP